MAKRNPKFLVIFAFRLRLANPSSFPLFCLPLKFAYAALIYAPVLFLSTKETCNCIVWLEIPPSFIKEKGNLLWLFQAGLFVWGWKTPSWMHVLERGAMGRNETRGALRTRDGHEVGVKGLYISEEDNASCRCWALMGFILSSDSHEMTRRGVEAEDIMKQHTATSVVGLEFGGVKRRTGKAWGIKGS
ncbi:hypothetical protein V8F33_005373 [Rhypophila sp. PSN 637]